MKAESTGLIILAAGASQRLGRPKQLLPYGGNTLLKHSIQAATGSIADHIVVVLGAYAEQIIKEISGDKVQAVVNKDWQEGMASSIRTGMTALLKAQPDLTGVVIMLCDQPLITSALINELIKNGHNTGKAIIASAYGNVSGVPAWFHKNIFPELMELQGDTGAKAVIRRFSSDLGTVAFPGGSADIDTEADYKLLMQE